MVELGRDQADGLRRMFSAGGARVIEIVAGEPGVGRTSLALNLGAALARLGRHTLLVDVVKARGASRLPSRLRLPVHGTDADSRRFAGADPEASPFAALEVVSERRATGVESPSAVNTQALLRASATRDCILVSSLSAERIVVAANGCRDLLVVVSPAASSITTAYALVKRVVYESGACRFGVVVNRAASAAAATHIFRNFARVALGYLDLRLEFAGFVPADPCVPRAGAHRLSVIDWSPGAPSARALLALAGAIGRLHGPAMLEPEKPARAADGALPVTG